MTAPTLPSNIVDFYRKFINNSNITGTGGVPFPEKDLKQTLSNIRKINETRVYLKSLSSKWLIGRLEYSLFYNSWWRFSKAHPSKSMKISDRIEQLEERERELKRRVGVLVRTPQTLLPNEPFNDLLYRPSKITIFLFRAAAIYSIPIFITLRTMGRLNWQLLGEVSLELFNASQNALNDWIIQPLIDIWKTFRYRNSNIALVSASALQADMQSLERMLVDFGRRWYPEISETEVLNQARSGDATLLLRKYEEELKSPIKNVLTGNLITMLLIQVQKSKVDLESSMMAIDRLLKANELNFELLAVIPILALLFFTFKFIRNKVKRLMGKNDCIFRDNLLDILNDLSQVLIRDGSQEELLGECFVLIDQFLYNWSLLSHSLTVKLNKKLVEDLRDLLSATLTTQQKLWTISRMLYFYNLFNTGKLYYY